MSEKPTVVVIGSGFGGSVFACRLAERQEFTIYVLERGRQYGRNEFPRRPDQLREAFWDPADGKFGMFEYQSFDRTDIDVLTASGLGGGSLIYANVLYEMPAEFFEGWPGGITRQTLNPYYQRVQNMMEARSYPVDQPTWPYAQTPKTRALQRAYDRISAHPLGHPAARLEWPKLAIQFGPRPGEEKANQQGVPQTTCIMCGECNIGCNYHAKNTLDLNYLARAANHGAIIRTNAEVRAILPKADHSGYTVVYSTPGNRSAMERIEAKYVIVAAGSLGSTKLLLRMRHSGQLPNLSAALGTRWSGNGDFLGLCRNSAAPVYPSTGPVITGAVRFFHAHYPDGFPHGLYIEDAGIPTMLAWYLTAMTPMTQSFLSGLKGAWRYLQGVLLGRRESNIGDDLGPLLFRESKLVSRTLVFLGMGRDRSSGMIQLRKKGRTPLNWIDDCEIHLAWDSRPSQLHFDRMRDEMQRLSVALGGTFLADPLSFLDKYISVHPLGGCPMGDSEHDGVVDARTGEVFGHKGLYVVDGSIIPTSIGPNPSLTIAALAEIFAERFP
ncbi:MAG: GMC family oxidoreductase [Candidatus Latescibacteria bacterium]|nr:GMC family oxidoreductase [Candidatus Latescibacterota bacterium]